MKCVNYRNHFKVYELPLYLSQCISVNDEMNNIQISLSFQTNKGFQLRKKGDFMFKALRSILPLPDQHVMFMIMEKRKRLSDD